MLGFLVSRALLAGSLLKVISILPPEFTEPTDSAGLTVPPGDWRVWAFLLGGAFVSTVMFGLLPALHSTRLELVRAMRGEVTKDARPSRVVRPFDRLAYSVGLGGIVATCLVGAFLPARRAARIDPIATLRAD